MLAHWLTHLKYLLPGQSMGLPSVLPLRRQQQGIIKEYGQALQQRISLQLTSNTCRNVCGRVRPLTHCTVLTDFTGSLAISGDEDSGSKRYL